MVVCHSSEPHYQHTGYDNFIYTNPVILNNLLALANDNYDTSSLLGAAFRAANLLSNDAHMPPTELAGI
jgi:hypothetical protein